MRTIGKSSLSSVLKVTLDVLWYLALVVTVVVIGMAIFSLFTDGKVTGHLDLPVVLELNEDIYSITGKDAGVDDATLEHVQAHLNFRTPSNAFLLFFIIYCGSGVALLLVVIHLLRKIFSTLAAGSPFVPSNAARIRLIGWIVIGAEFAEQLLQVVGQRIVMASFDTEGVTLRWDIDISGSTIFWGFVLLVLAEVFRLGVEMREDQEFTV